jgi:hypothetical protein
VLQTTSPVNTPVQLSSFNLAEFKNPRIVPPLQFDCAQARGIRHQVKLKSYLVLSERWFNSKDLVNKLPIPEYKRSAVLTWDDMFQILYANHDDRDGMDV